MSLPYLHDTDCVTGHLVASKLVNADHIVPESLVIFDGRFRLPEVASSPYPSDLDLHGRRICLPPCKEAGFLLKSFLGLREFQDGVVKVDLMSDLFVRASVFPVALQVSAYGRLVPGTALPNCSAVRLVIFGQRTRFVKHKREAVSSDAAEADGLPVCRSRALNC